MARPLRIEFAGALYHVTSRGDGRENIYLEEEDQDLWLDVLGRVCERFNWVSHAYCQMSNHYHLLIETPDRVSIGVRSPTAHWPIWSRICPSRSPPPTGYKRGSQFFLILATTVI